MSREILFRAKRFDTGEWMEGFYFFANIYVKTLLTKKRLAHYMVNESGEGREIDLSTVCQYTGLTDKNGQRIWENDIVRAHGGVLGIVKLGQYGDMKTDYGFYIEWDKTQPYWRNDICYWQPDIEVIGNIFDNPKLLEVEHEES